MFAKAWEIGTELRALSTRQTPILLLTVTAEKPFYNIYHVAISVFLTPLLKFASLFLL